MSNPAPKSSFSSARRWAIGFNVTLSVLSALALAVMANYLAARHFTRVYCARENPNQLSSLTLEMLRGLTNRIKVVVFYDRQDSMGLFSSVSSLLTEYQLACPKLEIEFLDYMRNPSAALLLKDRYKNAFPSDDSLKNMVLFDCGGRLKTVYEKELYDLDMSGPLTGRSKEVKRSNFKGELLFTSAIVSVTDSKQFKAYFLQGHGEHAPQDDDAVMGYSKFAAVLQQHNITNETLTLNARDIPADCSLLIVAGPRQRCEAAELEKIDRYLNGGGRLLALFNHEPNLARTRTGLDTVLAKWGVRVGGDIVFEMPEGATQPAGTKPLVVTNFPTPSHPIFKPLLRSQLHLVLPRTIEKLPAGRQDADAPRVDELAASDAGCVSAKEFRDGLPYIDPFRDRRGPIPLMVSVEKGSVQGLGADRGSTRMVIVGDSVFLGNQMIDSLANRDFAALAVNWLLDRSKLMGGIGPRPVKEYQVVMSPRQMSLARWILLAGLPGAVLLVGGLVWIRRRS